MWYLPNRLRRARSRSRPNGSSGSPVRSRACRHRRRMLEGGCLCGAVRYRISGSPLSSVNCHCESCRRASGAPAVAWISRRAIAIRDPRGLAGCVSLIAPGKAPVLRPLRNGSDVCDGRESEHDRSHLGLARRSRCISADCRGISGGQSGVGCDQRASRTLREVFVRLKRRLAIVRLFSPERRHAHECDAGEARARKPVAEPHVHGIAARHARRRRPARRPHRADDGKDHRHTSSRAGGRSDR